MKDLSEFLKACAEIEEALRNQNQDRVEYNFGINGGFWLPCGGGPGRCPGKVEEPGANPPEIVL